MHISHVKKEEESKDSDITKQESDNNTELGTAIITLYTLIRQDIGRTR